MRPLRTLLDRLARPAPQPRAPEAPGLDLMGTDFLADPYPFYAHLRQHDPVHRARQGSWVLTRHADIAAAFADPRLGNAPAAHAVVSARNRGRYVSADVAAHVLPFLDKPAHTQPRRLVATAFRAALRERPPEIDAIATELLRALDDRPAIDIIADYATPLAVRTISALLGLPAADAGDLARWAQHFFFLFAPMPTTAIRESTDTGLTEFRAYLADIVRRRRARPGDDLISRLLSADDAEGLLSEPALIDNCMLLVADGVENVDRGFANTLLALHRSPDQFARLRAAPHLAGAAIAEGLRFDPPGQLVARIAREDFDLGGHAVRKDGVVLLAVAAANRDPAVFDHPDRYDLARAESEPLSFGRGRHSCIGAPLVRAEMEGALGTLLRLAYDIAVDDRNLAWEARLGHRWLKALPVSLKRRPAAPRKIPPSVAGPGRAG
jgi:cytochrome P450